MIYIGIMELYAVFPYDQYFHMIRDRMLVDDCRELYYTIYGGLWELHLKHQNSSFQLAMGIPKFAGWFSSGKKSLSKMDDNERKPRF